MNFGGFGAPPPPSQVAPEAQSAGQAQAGGGFMFEPGPVGGWAQPQQRDAPPKSSMDKWSNIATGLGMANSMAVATGAGGLALGAGMAALGPAMIVFGPILGSILGKEKKPRYALGSAPLGQGGSLEDGNYIESKLTTIGFDNALSKGMDANDDAIAGLRGLTEIDNAMYELLDEPGRTAIQQGFTWRSRQVRDPKSDQTGEADFVDRYAKMIDVAAQGGSARAKNAQQVINDMYADYTAGYKAMLEGGTEAERELYRRKLGDGAFKAIEKSNPEEMRRRGREQVKKLLFSDKSRFQEPVETAKESIVRLDDGLMLVRDAEKRAAAERRQRIMDENGGTMPLSAMSDEELLAAVAADRQKNDTLEQKYAHYQSNGGKMTQEQFAARFGGMAELMDAGFDPRRGYSRTQERDTALEREYQDMGVASAVGNQYKDKYTESHSAYYGSQMHVGVQDFLQYAFLGLAGNTYEDIISGNIRQGTPQAQQMPQQQSRFGGFGGDVDQEATEKLNQYHGFGAGG